MKAPMELARAYSGSPFMEFSKLHSGARFNLASSTVLPICMEELGVDVSNLEITGDNVYGYMPLMERIARLKGVHADNVVSTAGTSMANFVAMASCLEPGDEVVVEAPGYVLIDETAKFLGAKVRAFERKAEEDFAIDPDRVKKAVTSKTQLIVVTNLHNPSSVLIPQSTLEQIGKIAESVGARVIVDEVYLESVRNPTPTSAFHVGECFLVTSSLTKAYGLGGLRCGWILAEPRLAGQMRKVCDLIAATGVFLAEQISALAIDRLDALASRAERVLAVNRKALNQFLDKRPDLSAVRPNYGTTSFPKLVAGSMDDFQRLLKDRYETSVFPGRFFGAPQHFRLGIGGDPRMTTEGLERLGAALDEFGKGRN